jgi:peptidyl-prolyl cis-trans isomerase A (cyclophilin A)
MRKTAVLILAGILGAALHVSAQTPEQAPATPKASTTPKTTPGARPGTITTRAYDRTLLRPALLKEKAPATYQVKFTTTRGDFLVTVTRAWS